MYSHHPAGSFHSICPLIPSTVPPLPGSWFPFLTQADLDPQSWPLWCVNKATTVPLCCTDLLLQAVVTQWPRNSCCCLLFMDFSNWPTPQLLARVAPSIFCYSKDASSCSRWLWLLMLSKQVILTLSYSCFHSTISQRMRPKLLSLRQQPGLC